jgi:hypothetical protein
MIDITRPVQLNKLREQREGLLPTGYWCKAFLLEVPTVGQTLRAARYERARQRPEEPESVKIEGLYVSSPVRTITEREDGSLVCETMNSTWAIVQLDSGVQPAQDDTHEGHAPPNPAPPQGAEAPAPANGSDPRQEARGGAQAG